jgi:phosphoribosylglycinamide formyltransferase-1
VNPKLRVAVLVSGYGSNLQALIDAAASPEYPAQIALVVSNVAGAYAIERARAAGLPVRIIDHRSFEVREDFERTLLEALREHRAELVCLAGFMRILSPGFLKLFRGQILNIHPSLLPAFPGLHAPRQALIHGAKITGCTVHFVDEVADNGPILVQAAVPVLPDDTEETLAARIHVEEHRIYPMAVRWVAAQLVVRQGRCTIVDAKPAISGLSLLNPSS